MLAYLLVAARGCVLQAIGGGPGGSSLARDAVGGRGASGGVQGLGSLWIGSMMVCLITMVVMSNMTN